MVQIHKIVLAMDHKDFKPQNLKQYGYSTVLFTDPYRLCILRTMYIIT